MNFNFDNREITANTADASSIRWVQDRMDDLDVRIAQRDFEEAVRSIEKGIRCLYQNVLMKGRQLLASMDPKQVTYPLMSMHLSHQAQHLTDILSHVLNLESHLVSSTKKYAQLLIRLGEEDLARSTYLQSRKEYVRRKIRAMQHPGAYGINDVEGFVEAVAWLIVRVVKNSWSVYSETFSEQRMASNFFEWVKEQVEGILLNLSFDLIPAFSEIFRRQLFGYADDSPLYKRSKAGVLAVWSELKGLGLDMTFTLEPLIGEHRTSKEGTALSSVASLTEGAKSLGLQSS